MLSQQSVAHTLQQLGMRPSRERGQNFLIADMPLEEIISAADVHAGETVLEIGPGLGALTEALLHLGAHVTAVEIDERLVAHLKNVIPKKFSFTLIAGDGLALRDDFLAGLGHYKVVANIPYHITSPLIQKFISARYPPTVAALLVQKEVAERVTAEPPRMSQLALFTQWFAATTYVATVPRDNFFPVPAVDSAIIRLEPCAGVGARHHLTAHEQKQFFSLIKRGFSHPRKQLGNNLSVDTATRARLAHFNFTRRAETLTHEEWITLAKTL